MTKNPILAANPEISAIVKASAGVGKTYLLVTRLMRLLLAGARPDAILAITFTRKASAEMQNRLFERLYGLATIPEPELKHELKAIGLEPTPALAQSARQLYETLIRSEHQVKTATFHAFCQEILRKFPMEANVPPGFELLEDESSFRMMAWDSLYDEATQHPQSDFAQALETLYEQCNGLHNTHQSLNSFLSQRNDWWAYTQGQADPVKYAIQCLCSKLNINPEDTPCQRFFSLNNQQKLVRLAQLFQAHNTNTNIKKADTLQKIIETECFLKPSDSLALIEKTFIELYDFFVSRDGENKHWKSVKAREKKIGEQGEADFLEICQDLVQQLITINEQRLKHHIFHLSSAWYTVGHRLISRYQKLKQEQRLLDFTDLEWNTYQLLNHSDNALWIQYKLDQRIDHLLIDEFQDTNPTQWRLILPLLEEFANVEDKSRSVFIVGDEKQSIYGFRRADPRLLKQAGEWLQENLQAKTFPMDKSRRSSPAIMQLLNSLFQIPYFEKRLPGFHEHATYLDNMPGEITLLPLIEKIDPSEQAIYFRNPLAQALPRQDQPYFREGQQIASHITQLIQQQKLIRTDNGQRPITYADIMLLIRSRTHVAEYERAFREARLPYLSNNKGTLFECQEIQDLLALMEVLYTPQNNLALATVLRSPIFQCNNEDLIMLASGEKHATSFQTGQQFVEKNTCSHRLAQAINHLTRWKTLSGHLPIHDLLDLIFHEINIFQQYLKNIPDHYKRRVQANLNQFLSLALEIESGRYPSIGRFIGKIRYMMQNDESPDEASDNSSNEQHHGVVRILTIHASKGLEAPVIFMADTADVKKDANNSYHALIQWPEHEEKPTEFILCPKKNEQTEGIKTLLQNETNKREIEDANLLYVALTRARQALYISGCQSSSKINKPSWYQLIKDHWPALHATLPQNKKTVSEKHQADTDTPATSNTLLFDNANNCQTQQFSEPSHHLAMEQSALRGSIIHRVLELFENSGRQEINVQINEEFSLIANEELIKDSIKEAESVVAHPEFTKYYNKEQYTLALNEMPVLLTVNKVNKSGIIDRLIVTNNEVIILDYKTHSNSKIDELSQIAADYRNQMRFYQAAIEKLYPTKRIRLIILFTHYLQTVEL